MQPLRNSFHSSLGSGLRQLPLGPRSPLLQGRFEIRSARAQQSFEEFRRLSELFIRRVDFIRNRMLDGAAPLVLLDAAPYSTRDQTRHFHQFVTESGLSWKDYQPSLRGPFALYGFDSAGTLMPPPLWKETCLRLLNWVAPH